MSWSRIKTARSFAHFVFYLNEKFHCSFKSCCIVLQTTMHCTSSLAMWVTSFREAQETNCKRALTVQPVYWSTDSRMNMSSHLRFSITCSTDQTWLQWLLPRHTVVVHRTLPQVLTSIFTHRRQANSHFNTQSPMWKKGILPVPDNYHPKYILQTGCRNKSSGIHYHLLCPKLLLQKSTHTHTHTHTHTQMK